MDFNLEDQELKLYETKLALKKEIQFWMKRYFRMRKHGVRLLTEEID